MSFGCVLLLYVMWFVCHVHVVVCYFYMSCACACFVIRIHVRYLAPPAPDNDNNRCGVWRYAHIRYTLRVLRVVHSA